jgi:hypothetical protein
MSRHHLPVLLAAAASLAGAALPAPVTGAPAPAAAAPSAHAAHAAHAGGAPHAAADGARVARRWGEEGHRLVGEAAARALPVDMPAFFRNAVEQLAYLNPEPDRWRAPRDATPLDAAMDPAYAPDHFVDLELLPAGALRARDRHAFADSLRKATVSPQVAGFLPYRIVELTARLREEFRLWRRAATAQERAWIEARIVNDAGILGHYVADGANPHHTSIHYNGWTGPNPKGYTPTGTNFHWRFESEFVRGNVTRADVSPLVDARARALLPLRDSVGAYLERSHRQLERLYELDKREAFGPTTRGADHKRFAVERLAAGATMLRDVWWTAWVASAETAPTR